MAQTTLEHAVLTVTEVEVFVQTMKYINEQNLWDEAQAYLAAAGKTEMLVDGEAFHLLGKMLAKNTSCNQSHPIMIIILEHLARLRNLFSSFS